MIEDIDIELVIKRLFKIGDEFEAIGAEMKELAQIDSERWKNFKKITNDCCDLLTDAIDLLNGGSNEGIYRLARYFKGFVISAPDEESINLKVDEAIRFEIRLLNRFVERSSIPVDFVEQFAQNCRKGASFNKEDEEQALDDLAALRDVICKIGKLGDEQHKPAIILKDLGLAIKDGAILVADTTTLLTDLSLISAFVSCKSIYTSGQRIRSRVTKWREYFEI